MYTLLLPPSAQVLTQACSSLSLDTTQPHCSLPGDKAVLYREAEVLSGDMTSISVMLSTYRSPTTSILSWRWAWFPPLHFPEWRREKEADESITLTHRRYADQNGEEFSYCNSEGHQVPVGCVRSASLHLNPCPAPTMLSQGLTASLQACCLLFQRLDSPSYIQT